MLAVVCGLSKQAIGQIENSTTKEPKPSNLKKIAEACGVRSEWLIDGSGLMFASDNSLSEEASSYNGENQRSQGDSPTLQASLSYKSCSPSAKRLIARIIAAEANHTSSPQLISALTQMMDAVIPETSNNDYKKLMDEFNEPDS